MKGFTLIELLVVVLIIGILSSVALPQYTKAVNKSRLTELQTLQSSLEKATDVYLLANGGPSSLTDLFDVLDISFPEFTTTRRDFFGNGTMHCNSKDVCVLVEADTNGGHIAVSRGSSFDPLFYLLSLKNSMDAPWTRGYYDCGGGISKFGLESLGYTSYFC